MSTFSKFKGKDFPISELRVVQLYWRTDSDSLFPHPSEHLMHHSQVNLFVTAQIKLHHEVGNPHTGVKLDNLWAIMILDISVDTVSYWWCTADLQENHSPHGAQLNQTQTLTRVWAHPDLLKQEEEDRKQELVDEWELEYPNPCPEATKPIE